MDLTAEGRELGWVSVQAGVSRTRRANACMTVSVHLYEHGAYWWLSVLLRAAKSSAVQCQKLTLGG